MKKILLIVCSTALASCSVLESEELSKNRHCLYDAELVKINKSDPKKNLFDIDVKILKADNLNNTKGCQTFEGDEININTNVTPFSVSGRSEIKEVQFSSLVPNDMKANERLVIWEQITETDSSTRTKWEIAPVGVDTDHQF
jgi:hypothetical protein